MSSIWFETALTPEGWRDGVRVEIADGVIASIGEAEPQPRDERAAIGVPGLCNVHSHGFQRGMAGLGETRGASDDDFWTWREVMYRFLEQMTPEDIEAISALAYAEMLESGYTRVGEFHYVHNDPDGRRYDDPAATAAAIVAAAEGTGIGLTLLPVFYAHSDFGGVPPKPGQRRFISDLDGFAALYERCRALLPADATLGVAPHSLRAVTADELAALLEIEPTGPVHIHAAEQLGEVEASLAFSGARPVEWLLANAPVNERWCLVHATHMTDAECRGLAASGAVAGLCPVTEANLGDGIFPAREYLAAGGVFATGTDSNIAIDAAQELRALEYSQRLKHRGRNLLGAEERASVGASLFQEALAGGARALGVRAGLEAGAPADIIALDADHPALVARAGDSLLDGWIFSGGRDCMDRVWRGGVKLVEQGRHIARDSIRERYRKTLAKLLSA